MDPGGGEELVQAVLYPRGDTEAKGLNWDTILHNSLWAVCLFLSSLSLFPLLLRVSGLERKQRWVPICNLPKLHWSFILKCCTVQRHCNYPSRVKYVAFPCSCFVHIFFWCCHKLLFFCPLHVFVSGCFFFWFCVVPYPSPSLSFFLWKALCMTMLISCYLTIFFWPIRLLFYCCFTCTC